MKTLSKTLLTGFAALSMGAAAIGAQAQTQAPAQNQATAQNAARPHLTPEQRQAKMAEFAAKREAKLHADLGITSGQESAWQSFVAAMKPATNGQRGQQFDRAAWTGLSAPQRMQKMIDLQKQRTTRMEQQLSALNSFYSVLSPQQKQVFDTESAQMGRHRFGHGHGQGGHGNWQRGGQTAQG